MGVFGEKNLGSKTSKILSSIYRFLAKLSYHQQNTQDIMMQYLDYFIKHLKDSREIPCHFLI